uniref:Uncharacterized protein TCIL3000_11_16210 n=1 Tax=Trypanosoma congolense (strain IL3000) TaxID=1068625 RepID=G0V388_TRYCI|nr:unnamed protein product [Trypanosoma congolense IL3000]
MEVLGRSKCAVMSVAASSTCDTNFASLDAAGAVTLWDMRLKKKDYMRVEADSTVSAFDDATELLFAADMHRAFVITGERIGCFDLRRHAVLDTYRHTCELVMFLDGVHPQGETTSLVIDENGAIMPFCLLQCAPAVALSARFFGSEQELTAPSFGSLTNLCCGLGFLDSPQGGRPILCAVGMDGRGAVFTEAYNQKGEFNLMGDDWLCPTGGEMINPPLLTSCSFMGGFLAIGRANGMYSIAVPNDNEDSVVDVFSSPGHAQNNLSVVKWCGPARPRLFTCSVCGELSVWDVLPLLEAEEVSADVDVEEGDPPPLMMSGSVREVTGQAVSVNCGTVVGGGKLVVGDTMGFLTACSVE